MNPVWKNVLQWAMPFIIEAGSNLYKQQSDARKARQSNPNASDSQAEQIEALKSAMIRLAEEAEVHRRKQIDLAQSVASLRWMVIGLFVLTIISLIIAASK